MLNHVKHEVKIPRLLDTLRMTMGGETKTMDSQGAPCYAAIYELESPDVLVSAAFAKAVDHGRWPGEVRPFTSNRHHTLYRVMREE